MGQLKQVLFVQPPLFMQVHPVVREESRGHQCSVCNGSGEVSDEIYNKDSRFKECPFCKGVKKVKVVITMEWMPDNNKD